MVIRQDGAAIPGHASHPRHSLTFTQHTFSAPVSVNEEILQVIGAGCTLRCVQNVRWV